MGTIRNLYWLGLAAMVGLGGFSIHHPTHYAMPVCMANLAVLVIISQVICWNMQGGKNSLPESKADLDVIRPHLMA